MLATIHTSAVNGLTAMPVFLEVNGSELPKEQEVKQIFQMVGLPDNAVRESKLRVEGALQQIKALSKYSKLVSIIVF